MKTNYLLDRFIVDNFNEYGQEVEVSISEEKNYIRFKLLSDVQMALTIELSLDTVDYQVNDEYELRELLVKGLEKALAGRNTMYSEFDSFLSQMKYKQSEHLFMQRIKSSFNVNQEVVEMA